MQHPDAPALEPEAVRAPGPDAVAAADAEDRLRAGDLAILAALAAVVIAAVVGFLWYLDREAARQHVEAPVDILLVTPVAFVDGNGEQDIEYDISYRFEAGGQLFAGLHTESWHDRRERRKVCYNPENPADHSLVSWATTCGETLLFGR